jgi:hypothetical protein
MRDQVVMRYKSLNLPTYWAAMNVDVSAQAGNAGVASNVRISYPRDPVRQYLNYGRMYDPGLPR